MIWKRFVASQMAEAKTTLKTATLVARKSALAHEYAFTASTTDIDFEGFLDGVAFDGGKGEKYPLVLGSGSFIPGFEEKIIGKNVGDELEFGGLLGSGPVMNINKYSPEKFIARGGRIPAPLQSLKN